MSHAASSRNFYSESYRSHGKIKHRDRNLHQSRKKFHHTHQHSFKESHVHHSSKGSEERQVNYKTKYDINCSSSLTYFDEDFSNHDDDSIDRENSKDVRDHIESNQEDRKQHKSHKKSSHKHKYFKEPTVHHSSKYRKKGKERQVNYKKNYGLNSSPSSSYFDRDSSNCNDEWIHGEICKDDPLNDRHDIGYRRSSYDNDCVIKNSSYQSEKNQENERIKHRHSKKKNHADDTSIQGVNITFENKKLRKKFCPVLEELVAELIRGSVVVEDLEALLFSKKYSLTKDSTVKLFALDNSTCEPNEKICAPRYKTSFQEILQDQHLKNEIEAQKNKSRNIGRFCFNCSEDHFVRDCPYPMDYEKIAMERKNCVNVPQVRYHEVGRLEKNIKPGVISDKLRKALHLNSDQVPSFIFRMRVLDYPPGWLKEAIVQTSGITLYDTDEQSDKSSEAVQQSSHTQVQFDPAKLVDFPGFNVQLPENAIDESELLGWPPLQDFQLRSVFEKNIQKMVCLKMKPVKRKRNMFSPCKPKCKVQRLNEGNNISDFCINKNPTLPKEKVSSTSPLPSSEDELPLPQNNPSLSPSAEDEPLQMTKDISLSYISTTDLSANEENTFMDSDDSSKTTLTSTSIIEENIPVNKKFKPNNKQKGTTPSLKNLEEIKKELVLELKDGAFSRDSAATEGSSSNILSVDLSLDSAPIAMSLSEFKKCSDLTKEMCPTQNQGKRCPELIGQIFTDKIHKDNRQFPRIGSQGSKLVSHGTPSILRHSSFHKLPKYENFSKNVTDHINFENLPNSVGTYHKIRKVLKKMKEKIKSIM